jgi:oxygen-independent coproporphyrinogen-3 oxidase
MFRFTALPPLSLYVHIPWCLRKCPYCDFNSHEAPAEVPEKAYIQALVADLSYDLPRVWGRPVESIFIGGGTPSLFSPEAFDELLSHIRALLPVRPQAEITLEANPGTFETGKFREFRALGINRLSVGVQSFDPKQLQRLGRIHGRGEALAAAETAHAAGFDNFNLDLMFGLPEQTLAQARDDVATAIALEPSHLSYYNLTIEPNTYFHHAPPPLPDDDMAWEIQQQGQTLLQQAGFLQYEVSAYARAQRQCWHNLNYWRFGDYLGIGAGAHGKITDAQQQRITRLHKLRHPKDYLSQANRIAGETVIGRQDAPFEFMMNALRLNDGVETHLFAERVGLPISVAENALRQAEQQGLLQWTLQRFRATDKGRLFLNDLLQLFM